MYTNIFLILMCGSLSIFFLKNNFINRLKELIYFNIFSILILFPGIILFLISINNIENDTEKVEELISILKKPIKLVDFIFEQSSHTVDLKNIDEKIKFDKYLEDIVSKINDKKIQYFYKSEFKNLFFNRIKGVNKPISNTSLKNKSFSLINIQICSFIAAIINHKNISGDIIALLKKAKFLEQKQLELIDFLSNTNFSIYNYSQLIDNCEDKECKEILGRSLENKITVLFPYSSQKFDSKEALKEIKESVQNLNTRLSNLKKINKSLDAFVNEASSLNWIELQKINQEIQFDQETEKNG